jgi:hypothetical protein
MNISNLESLLIVFFVLLTCSTLLPSRGFWLKRAVKYKNPMTRLEVFDYFPRQNINLYIEGGELSPIFWSELLRRWRLSVKGKQNYSMKIIFGPTIHVSQNLYEEYVMGLCKMPGHQADLKADEWLHVHPVLQAWRFEPELHIELFLKLEHNLHEEHSILIESKRKTVLIEDQHGSSTAMGGVIYHYNKVEYQNKLDYFKSICDAKDKTEAPKFKVASVPRNKEGYELLKREIIMERKTSIAA